MSQIASEPVSRSFVFGLSYLVFRIWSFASMDYQQIDYELKHSPAIRVLRSRNAALILSFLHQQFKGQNQAVSIAQRVLIEKLDGYLDYLRDAYPEMEWRTAKDYLKDWCDNLLLLRKTFDKDDEAILSLTPAAEKAIAWTEELQLQDEFVGTESRFLQIFSLLKEIQDRSTADVETRVAQLEQDRDRIQQEIDRIREEGEVATFSQTQLQERFLSANQMTRQLVADFKAVEQNFRDLTRKVQTQQLEKGSRRGAVVGNVLDADQALRESDQGRSFYAFWEFLMSSSKQADLREMIQAVYTLDELQPLTRRYGLLRGLEYSLLDAAQYIVQSNHRLTEKLRQMLDERSLRENKRVAELIVEVQRLASALGEGAPEEADFWLVEGDPETQLVIERPLHPLEEPDAPTFDLDFADLPEAVQDEAAMAELFAQFYVDEAVLAERISLTLEQRQAVSLSELIQLYPVTQGLPEVVAYLSLATRSPQHSVDESTIESIVVSGLEPKTRLELRMPQIVFCR